MRAKDVVCLLGVVVTMVWLPACGSGDDSSSSGVGDETVHGTVTLPGKHEVGTEWTTAEIKRLLGAQEGVESVRCLKIAPGSFALRWTCTVEVEGQVGHITMRAQKDGHLSSTGDGIPGLKFG